MSLIQHQVKATTPGYWAIEARARPRRSGLVVLQTFPGICLCCRCRVTWHLRGCGQAGHTASQQESSRHDKQSTCILCPAVAPTDSLNHTHKHNVTPYPFGSCSVPACDHQQEAPSKDPERVEPLHLPGQRWHYTPAAKVMRQLPPRQWAL